MRRLSTARLSSVCFFCALCLLFYVFFFFFNDTATTEIYTLSLHDALPIFFIMNRGSAADSWKREKAENLILMLQGDRKSTRLNSSHTVISYAVFCLKKKKKKKQ